VQETAPAGVVALNLKRIAMLLLVAATHPSCDGVGCGNEVLEEAASPSGAYRATTFERNCGATTPFVRIVSIRLSTKDFDPEETEDWVFTIDGQPTIQVAWKSDKELTITHSGSGSAPMRSASWKDVKIGSE
jgi:hypothetical protein